MGYALAEEFAGQGAMVILISGPVSLNPIHKNITRIPVHSAEEMLDACLKYFGNSDIAVFSAAVADFTPVKAFSEKVKRKGDSLTIELKPTMDIARHLSTSKKENQLTVGFALETQNETENAIGKLKRKNLDMIVLNSLKDPGAGFGTDTNKITIIDKNNNIDKFELKSKEEVAVDIVNAVLRFM